MFGKLFWKFRSPQSVEEVKHGSLIRWQNSLANPWTSSNHQCEKSKFSIPLSPNIFPVKTVLQISDLHIKQHLLSDKRDSIATVVPCYCIWYLEKCSTFEGFLYQKLRYCLTVSRYWHLCSKDRKLISQISSLHLKKKKSLATKKEVCVSRTLCISHKIREIFIPWEEKKCILQLLMSHLISFLTSCFPLRRSSSIGCTVNTSLQLVNNLYELLLNACLALEMLLPSTSHSSLIREGQTIWKNIDVISTWNLKPQVIFNLILRSWFTVGKISKIDKNYYCW